MLRVGYLQKTMKVSTFLLGSLTVSFVEGDRPHLSQVRGGVKPKDPQKGSNTIKRIPHFHRGLITVHVEQQSAINRTARCRSLDGFSSMILDLQVTSLKQNTLHTRGFLAQPDRDHYHSSVPTLRNVKVRRGISGEQKTLSFC